MFYFYDLGAFGKLRGPVLQIQIPGSKIMVFYAELLIFDYNRNPAVAGGYEYEQILFLA
jgi:hypothetical protein